MEKTGSRDLCYFMLKEQVVRIFQESESLLFLANINILRPFCYLRFSQFVSVCSTRVHLGPTRIDTHL